jgi:hypothetical protein
MRRSLAHGAAAVTAIAVVAAGGLLTPAAADDDGLRDATRAEARAFFAASDLDGPTRCVLISFSRSNARWALVSPTENCGPNSGHSWVYKQGRDGQWKALFYDMQVDACEKFKVPAAVTRDLRPYVC